MENQNPPAAAVHDDFVVFAHHLAVRVDGAVKALIVPSMAGQILPILVSAGLAEEGSRIEFHETTFFPPRSDGRHVPKDGGSALVHSIGYKIQGRIPFAATSTEADWSAHLEAVRDPEADWEYAFGSTWRPEDHESVRVPVVLSADVPIRTCSTCGMDYCSDTWEECEGDGWTPDA